MKLAMILVLVALVSLAQTTGNSRYYTGTTPPVGCVAGRDFWLNTTVGVNDALRLASCTSNNVWTVLSGAGGAGTGNVVGPAPGTAGVLTTVDAAGTALSRTALTGVIKTASGVPAVVTGTATDFVRVDGTSAPAGVGSGNVTGPGVGTSGAGTTIDAAGTTLTRSTLTGVIKATGGVPSVVTGTATDFVRVDGTSAPGGTGGVAGPSAGAGGEGMTINAAGTVLTRSNLTGVIKATAGVPSIVTGAGTNFVRVDGTSAAAGGTGDVTGASNLTTANKVVIVNSAGAVTQGTGCTYATNGITCTGGFTSGDGTAQSGVILPELTANGTNDFRMYGAANQTADGCVVFTGTLASGESWRGSATTTVVNGKTCRVMETYTPSAGGPAGLDLFDPGVFVMYEEFIEGPAVNIGSVFGGTSGLRTGTWNGASGSVTAGASSLGHPGIFLTNPGVTTGRGTILHYQFLNVYGQFALSTAVFDSYWIWSNVATIANQGNYTGFLAAGESSAAPPTTNNGCWWRRLATDTNFQCVCSAAGTATVVDYGLPPVADRFYRTAIYATTPGTIKFRLYDNGVAVGTEVSISTNVPTANLEPFYLHLGVGVSVNSAVDKFALKQTGITNR